MSCPAGSWYGCLTIYNILSCYYNILSLLLPQNYFFKLDFLKICTIITDTAEGGRYQINIQEQKGTEERVASVPGHIAAADENVRIVEERRDSKRNSVKLHAQMSVDNAKAKVEAHKEAVDKAAMEAYILDVLDYSESCRQLAYAWALEAEYAVNEALAAINEYTEKFGRSE